MAQTNCIEREVRGGRWSEGYAAWLIRHRWLVLVMSTLLCVATATGLSRLGFSSDYRDFFQPDDPQLLAHEALRSAYSDDFDALVAFVPADGTVFSKQALAAIAQFTEKAWELPHARRVDSLTNYQHAEADEDLLRVRPLYQSQAAEKAEGVERVRAIALSESALVGRLVSPDGAVAGVSINFTLPAPTEVSTPESVHALRRLIETHRAEFPEIRVLASGGILLDTAFEEQAQGDLETLIPMMYGLILIVMFIALRSAMGVLAALLVMTLSILASLGVTGWLGLKLTAVSVSAPTILTTIAVASCLHIIVYASRRMAAGIQRLDAVRESVAVNMPIVAMACGTDALGFFSMCLSDVPPIAAFGVILGVGALAVFVFTTTFLPACLALLPLKGSRALLRQGNALGRLAAALVDWRRSIFVCVSVLAILGAWFTSRNQLEDNFVEYFSPAVEFRRDTDFINAHLTGVHTVYYSVPAPAGTTVASASYLQALDRFATWLRAQPEVHHVDALSDIVKRIHRTIENDSPSAYRIPDDDLQAAQMLLLFEMSLPPGLDLNDQIRVDRSASKLTVVLGNITSVALVDFDRRVHDWMGTNLLPGMATYGTGPSMMFSRIGELNVAGTLKGYVLQILLISLVIGVAMRSVRLGLASLLPNVLPSLLAFGIWGAMVGHVGLSVAVVGVLTYGIIVDDTIHSVYKYHIARTRHGLGSRAAIEYAYSNSGIALVLTTAVLVTGFGVLTFSHFDLNADLGMMSMFTIGMAGLIDLVLLPPLLYVMDRRTTGETPHTPCSTMTEGKLSS
ncbi:MMPL family transporter [Cupriavidus sp. BIS7]|uniref:efflux RND transporter permease subunit n=1 Tax=Cupriavidus sp. BIS7 TaxID=1217718 RepID=UPI0003182B11|nr:MMPL family transporter [Cupriavidus sp. BIS7]